MAQKNLHIAKQQKLDEFYTQIGDIERECSRYREQFKGKVIFLNCDDPVESNFFRYFALKFEYLGLKKLVATHFEKSKPSYKLEITKGLDVNNDDKIDLSDIVKIPLKQNGDFRSDECVEILKEADIVVTNPPFSLFREYIAQLMEYNKQFLVIGNKNAITYKEVIQYIKEDQLRIGYRNINSDIWFILPDDAEKWEKIVEGKKMKHVMACWYTNLDVAKHHEIMPLYKKYIPEEYPKYDNYDAINVNAVADIPADYDGVMGVPITYLDKHNPEQFEIVKFRKGDDEKDLTINGKSPYFRILIKRRPQS